MEKEAPASLLVRSMQGALLHSVQWTGFAGENRLQVPDMNALPTGMYQLQLCTPTEIYTGKWVKI